MLLDFWFCVDLNEYIYVKWVGALTKWTKKNFKHLRPANIVACTDM